MLFCKDYLYFLATMACYLVYYDYNKMASYISVDKDHREIILSLCLEHTESRCHFSNILHHYFCACVGTLY